MNSSKPSNKKSKLIQEDGKNRKITSFFNKNTSESSSTSSSIKTKIQDVNQQTETDINLSLFREEFENPAFNNFNEFATEQTVISAPITESSFEQSQTDISAPITESLFEQSTTISEIDKTLTKVPNDLGKTSPNQPVINFPKSIFWKYIRCFQSDWYDRFPWIEYSAERDTVFCFVCRNFLMIDTKDAKYIEDTFITQGFNNWKTALEKDRGFQKHEKSESHVKAFSAWNELKIREKSGNTIGSLLADKQIENNRYYIKSIFEIIQILVVNKLRFRGNFNEEL